MIALVLVLSLLSVFRHSHANIDPDKAAELSREIREHFRSSGANWVSPRMFKKINLLRNEKPIMFVYTTRSCMDCRDFMDSWAKLDRVTVSSLTAQFLSVLVLDDYALEMEEYSPLNADYLPRVTFANPDGTFRDIQAPQTRGGGDAPYFYETADQVVTSMRLYLANLQEEMGLDVFQGDLKEDI